MRSILCTARSGAILAVVLTLVLALAAPVTAGATTLEVMSLVITWESGVSDQPTLVVSGRLSDDTPLPAEMVLPVPEGANVLWAGEFLADTGQPNLQLPAEVETRDGLPVVVLRLTQSRIGLADMAFPSSRIPVQEFPDVYETVMDVRVPVEVANVYAAVAMPDGMERLSSSEPVTVSQEPDGYQYHSVERTDVSAGERIFLSMQVRETPIVSDQVNETVPWMVALVIAVIIGAAVVLIFVRKRNTDTET